MTRKNCQCLLPAIAYLLLAAAILPLLTGCAVRQAYFVSPFNGNNLEYHTIPKRGDSIHAAVFSSLSYSNGSANDFGTDYLWSVHTSMYAAHSYDKVQFHYGLGVTLGKYSMGTWRVDTMHTSGFLSSNTALPTAVQVNTYSGPHSFGGVGFQGGINGVKPVGRGEWRYLGLETSVSQEFGKYLGVRKQMPDSIATLIDRSPFFATVGLTTEIVGYIRNGEIGFKWAFGYALGHAYNSPGMVDNSSGDALHYTYFNFTFHYNYRRFTGYLQVSEATKAKLVFLGVDYRLWANAKRKAGDATE